MSNSSDKKTDTDVEAFLASVENTTRRNDARHLMDMLAEITGHEPRMWGASIIGYDRYHYKYDSGHEGDGPLIGISPRKAKMSVYIMPGFDEMQEELSRLGPHKTGASCLYLGSLEKLDKTALRQILEKSVQIMRARYHRTE